MNGNTALLQAARNGHIEIVKMAIEHGADINGATNHGSTALLLSAEHGHINIVKMAIEQGAHLGMADNDGDTALICAALGGQMDVCKYLCEKQVDISVKNKEGKTAEEVATDRGHPLVARFLKKVRLGNEIRKIGQEPGKVIKESDLPVKMFVAGPAQAGKTTIVCSIFEYTSKSYLTSLSKPLWGVITWARGWWEQSYISEDHKQRTIALTIHSKRLFGETLYLVYDLGGQECYYALQSVFLDLENAFFLIVADVAENDEILKDHIKKQLHIISSKLLPHANAKIIFIGTHMDLIEDKEHKRSICKEALISTDCNNVDIVEEFFINATAIDSSELKRIIETCKTLGEKVHHSMSDDRKKIPKFLLPVLEDLKKTSECLKKKVLDWETILNCVRETVKRELNIVDLAGYQVFYILDFLNQIGLLLMASPDVTNVDLDAFDDIKYGINVMVDLNWFISSFLGPLFSPQGFLKSSEICVDGYISEKYLEAAFKGFGLKKDELVQILDCYQLIVEEVHENGQTRYLIPSALKSEKNPQWMSWKEGQCPYFYMIGRVCSSNKLMNPSTLTKILHSTKKEFPDKRITFYQGGFFMKTERCQILVEPTLSYTGFKAKLGILTSRAGENREEVKSQIKKGVEYFDKVFNKICKGCMTECNPSSSMELSVLNLKGMKERDDKPYYKFSEAYRYYTSGHAFIDHAETNIFDIPALLLTWAEMERETQKTTVAYHMDKYIDDYIDKIFPEFSQKLRKQEDCSSSVQSVTITGNVGKLHIGPSTIHAAESSKVTTGDNIEMNIHES